MRGQLLGLEGIHAVRVDTEQHDAALLEPRGQLGRGVGHVLVEVRRALGVGAEQHAARGTRIGVERRREMLRTHATRVGPGVGDDAGAEVAFDGHGGHVRRVVLEVQRCVDVRARMHAHLDAADVDAAAVADAGHEAEVEGGIAGPDADARPQRTADVENASRSAKGRRRGRQAHGRPLTGR